MSSNLNLITDSPVFAGFLIDASGSMERYQRDVIEGHGLMLSTLRESEKCDLGVLYVYQSLFADHPKVLHGFYALDRNGNDQIATLDARNYAPGGMTALFDAIITMAKDLEAHLDVVAKQGLLPAARIAVITDGAENASKARKEEVQAVIQRLRSREWLHSSVVVGLKNPEFDDAKLEALRAAIGFSQKIGLDRNPREIRRAFVLASKPKADKN
jgi:Mg-chelatase subunit ChlD